MIREAIKFEGTVVYTVLTAIDSLYKNIEAAQKQWKQACPMQCPEGCGSCCAHFEPEIYEAEALYLAAWMLEHQSKRAEQLAETGGTYGTDADACILFDPDSPYHCTVYGGRCLICRLFGFSGDHSKDGYIRWKPCRHMQCSDKMVEQSGIHTGQLRRQYTQEEMLHLFGAVPPYMGAFSAALLALNPDDTRPRPLRSALPAAIKKLKMLLRFLTPPEPDCPSPHPLSA